MKQPLAPGRNGNTTAGAARAQQMPASKGPGGRGGCGDGGVSGRSEKKGMKNRAAKGATSKGNDSDMPYNIVVPSGGKHAMGGFPMFGEFPFVGTGTEAGQWSTVAPMTPPAPQQAMKATCSNCKNECSTRHRFCAFCGSQISSPAILPSMAQQNSYMMRADAP